jgi:hypothetical protein
MFSSFAMPEPGLSPELLRSLGKLVRGLSALFWGLPITLLVSVGTLAAGWFNNPLPAMAGTGLLLYGLWQVSYFQKQERPWRLALDRARLLGMVNFGLSPFLFACQRIPGQPYYVVAVAVLGLSGLFFLFDLNVVLARLSAMLPDETLRQETQQFTAINRTLLVMLLAVVVAYFVAVRMPDLPRTLTAGIEWLNQAKLWSLLMVLVFFLLLPLSITMALLWKTKEVILESLFSASH